MTTEGWRSQGPDFIAEYRHLAQQLARRYAVMEGVVGVLLAGGLTFGEADRHSDVDLAVYLQHQSRRTWYLGEAPLPEGESIYHGLRLDVSYRDFDAESNREWTRLECWAFSRAEVLYDPEGLVRELLDAKLGVDAGALAGEALELAAGLRYTLERTVPAWLYRGEIAAAQYALNHAADETVRLIFLVNGQPAPREDWRIPLLRELSWTPPDIAERLKRSIIATSADSSGASRRRYELNRIISDCWERLAPGEAIEMHVETLRQTVMLRVMASCGEMPLSTFRERFDVSLLIRSPSFELLEIDRTGDEPVVRFNHERLEYLIHHQLARFLDYQQRILRELADRPGIETDW